MSCACTASGPGRVGGGVELMLSLTSKLIMLTQSVPVISFFSQPFFKRAATPTRRTAAHTHTYTQHALRIHATPGATKTPTGQAARRQQLTSEECGKVLRGEGGDAPLAVRERPTGRLPSYSN